MKHSFFYIHLFIIVVGCSEPEVRQSEFSKYLDLKEIAAQNNDPGPSFSNIPFGITSDSLYKVFLSLEKDSVISYDNNKRVFTFTISTTRSFNNKILMTISSDYYNDSLYQIILKSVNSDNAKGFMNHSDLYDVFKEKYGYPTTFFKLLDDIPETYVWLKGSTEIKINTIAETTVISYTNLKLESRKEKAEKEENAANSEKSKSRL